MTTLTINGVEVVRIEDGFFVDPSLWRKEMADTLAKSEGIEELTPRHWEVIRFMRDQFNEKGAGPSMRVLGKVSGVPIKELYQLFPKGPAKQAAKIAGIPKPIGCI